MSEHNQERPGLLRRGGNLIRRETSYIFGWEHVKEGAKAISTQWTKASKRVCPDCGAGRLFPFKIEQDGQELKFYGCNRCSYFQAAKLVEDEASLQRLRKLGLSKIADLTEEEHEELMRKYRIGSRWLYSFSMAVVLFGVYMLIEDGAAWAFLNALMVSLLLFVQGMVASYRCWQVREKILFVPGAWKRWLRSGQWLI